MESLPIGNDRMKPVLLGTGILVCGIFILCLPVESYTVAFAAFLVIGLGCAPIYPCIIHSTPYNFGAENSGRLLESRCQALMSVRRLFRRCSDSSAMRYLFPSCRSIWRVCCHSDYDGGDNIPHHPQEKRCKNVTDVYDRKQRVIHNQFKEEEKWQKDQRFEKIYSQGTMTTTEIWVDKETGVDYVFHASGYARRNDAASGSRGSRSFRR